MLNFTQALRGDTIYAYVGEEAEPIDLGNCVSYEKEESDFVQVSGNCNITIVGEPGDGSFWGDKFYPTA